MAAALLGYAVFARFFGCLFHGCQCPVEQCLNPDVLLPVPKLRLLFQYQLGDDTDSR